MKQLLELAKKRFPDNWTKADDTLFGQTAIGKVAYYGDGDPAEADKWNEVRVLQADRIEWLCTDREATKEVKHRGVQIIGARIEGVIDLSYAKIEFLLSIQRSAIPRGMVMQRCHLYALFLTGTHTGPINADGLRVEHDLHMRKGFHAEGEVRLLGARIGGGFSCSKGHFSNPTGVALSADRINVKGDVLMDNEFKAEGQVRLLDATIGGSLNCSNSHYSKPTDAAIAADGIELGIALSADRIDVTGDVLMDNDFKAEGEVRLGCATIGVSLVCCRGHFCNPSGVALAADGIDVKGAVFLCDEFKAEGEVRLLGAKIGQVLDCSNGHFSRPTDVVRVAGRIEVRGALCADWIDVKGGVFLRDEFKAEGEVRLLGAKIGGDLNCSNGHFSNSNGAALQADHITVGGSVFFREHFRAEGRVVFIAASVGAWFEWSSVKDSDQCALVLESAKIGTLYDEEKTWPAKLLLDGLVYDRLHTRAPPGSDARLRWLKRQAYDNDKFVPQPYMQLAKVLQEMGHEADGRRILIAKQKDPARVAALTIPARIWHHLLGLTICYGYRPWWAALWIAGFIVVGTGLFQIGADNNLFQKTIQGEPPTLNTFVYSLDSFVPLIDLHQAKYRLPTGCWLRVYHWIHIAFGWILTTLFAVGLTGLVRK